MNPYEELGVPPDAKPDQIKRAHRKAIRKHHPDAGGDPGKFLAVQRSFEILMDKDDRDRFDETGATERDSLMEESAKIMELVAETLRSIIQGEHDLVHSDIGKVIRVGLKGIRAQIEAAIADNAKLIARTQIVQRRFARKANADPKAPIGILEAALEAGMASLEREDRKHRENLDLHTKVEATFAAFDYSFDIPPPPPEYPGQRYYQAQEGMGLGRRW